MSTSMLQAPKTPPKPRPFISKRNPISSSPPLKFQIFPKSHAASLNLNLHLPSQLSNSSRIRAVPDLMLESAEEDARDAVSLILQEAGASAEAAAQIASNSPNYLRMLIDGVRELDEASLWDSWKFGRDGGRGIEISSFKEKVYYLGKEKKDKGILPFLESVGLSSSGSMRVARYLSSRTLPSLMEKNYNDKVKYVKAMFFSSSDEDVPIGKNARRMLLHLSSYTDDDIQHTISFFAKMEARRGGLDMLDSGEASFPYLIESFPRILLLSEESHFKPLVEFLGTMGVSKGWIRSVVLLFPPIVFYDIGKDIKPRLRALGKVGIEHKDIGRMVVKYPWVLSTSIQENYGNILSFFYAEKVPKARVDQAIRSWPHVLGCSTSKMKSMVDQFAELGVRNRKLGQVIAKSPQLLLKKPDEFLEELGFDKERIGKILSRCPEIFAASVENTLRKKLNLLIKFGISQRNLPRVIRKYPELLVSDVNNTLLPRMKYLMKNGLSEREVVSMIVRFSPLLGYSIEEVLKPKFEFLVGVMRKPLKDIVEYPRYFSYSLEGKIQPRHWVLVRRNMEYSLKEMLGKNDEDFAADYMGIGRMLVPMTDEES
ncbi:hypothetical protein ACLOJK_030863 [Asimina triloba]